MSFHDPLTLKLSLREKFAYGVGDFGSNLMLCIGTLYLLKFYTDELGMPAYYGGIIFLVAKFFTAFTDMLTGVLLDSEAKYWHKRKIQTLYFICVIPCRNRCQRAVFSNRFYAHGENRAGDGAVYAVWSVL